MITQINDLMNNKIERTKAAYAILDVVVNTTGANYPDQAVKMDPEQGIFIINISHGHDLVMGIQPNNDFVSVFVIEENNRVAELNIAPNGECEERFRKIHAGIEFKNSISNLFSMISTAIESMGADDISDAPAEEENTTVDDEPETVEPEIVS